MSVGRWAGAALAICLSSSLVADVRGAQAADAGAGLAVRDYVAQVLATHPALLAAQAEVDAARARLRAQGRPLYNPELDVEYDNALDNGTRVGITQRFNVVGKRGARKAVASAELRAAEARYRILRKRLAVDLLTALAVLQAARERQALARNRVSLDEEFLAIAERRWREGDIPQASLLTARLALAQARAERSAAEIALSQARENLEALAGRIDLPPPPLPGAPESDDLELGDDAIRRLPEIRLAEAQVRIAQALVQVARKNRIPDPAISLSLGRERGGFDMFGRRERTTAFGVGLSVPLPVRNGFRAEVDAARARRVAADRALADTLRTIRARVHESARRHRLAVEAWTRWRQQGQIPLTDQRSLLRRLWRSGDIGAADFLLQINQTFATEEAGILTKERLWTSWFAWLGASSRIDAWLEGAS